MTVNAGCGGYRPVPEFDPGEIKQPHALDGTPLTRYWRARPLRGPSAPVATDTVNAYLGGSDRRVVAVDLASGKTRWAVRMTGPIVGGVLEEGDVVYAATDQPGGKVVALRKESGRQNWSTGTGYVQAPMALTEGRLIVLNRKGEVLGLRTSNGKIQWKKRLPSNRVPPAVLDPGVVMVTSYDSLYTLRVRDGQILARRRAPGVVTSPWIRFGTSLVGATGDSTVIAIAPDSLHEQWRVRLDAPLLVSPAAQGDTLFCVTRAGSVYRIVPGGDPLEARIHSAGWPATGTPALFGPWLLVGGADGTLYGFDRESGEQSWKVALGRPAELPVYLLYDGTFLAVGGAGDLHRIGR
ncbi:MAG TPA: PQQ-binding-like beta-propeller repeat protein [Gemmatimonadales bacterium]|nr:PQQ-binding-like beta-propeller repeat protein [Gemmatimonadales bacterium]